MSGDSEIISKFRDMGMSDRSDMINKEYAWVPDTNNGSYNGQITFDLTSLGQSQRWINYSEAYIEIPYVISAKSTIALVGPAIVTAASLGLKDGFHQLIDSLSVEINGRTVIQTQNFINAHTQFKLLTTSSFNDITKNGPTNGFFSDGMNFTFNAVPGDEGIGYCNSNNEIFAGRKGQTTNYDPTVNVMPTINAEESIAAGRSYFSREGSAENTIYTWVVLAQIRLSDITDLFSKIPICKTTDIRLTINYNSSKMVVGCTFGPTTYRIISYQQVSGHSCAYMLSPASFIPTAACELSISSNVMKSGLGTVVPKITNCRLYVPFYKASDSVSLALIQSFPTTTFNYNDIYTYLVPDILPGSNFCNTLTTGILDPQYLIVIPFPKTNALPNLNIATYQSPFDTAPGTTSGIILKDFNVQIAGVNVFPSNIKYDFEMFNHELSKINAIDGNMTLGLTNGILNYYMFQQGYRMYIADLSRKEPSQSNVTKSITITGYNTTAIDIELICFIAYKKKLSIQTSTGVLQD